MKYITPAEMKEIDRRAVEDFGIPSIILMENAGGYSAEVALDMISAAGRKKVFCVCGKGNNGGDGFVCARHLINKGIVTEIFLVGTMDEIKGDAKVNLDILMKMEVKIETLQAGFDILEFKKKLKDTSLIIDAIFGIGLSGKIREPYGAVINAITESEKPVLAIDVPSGLDAATGDIMGICIKARKTVTFGLPKSGFIKKHGPSKTGEVIIADISIPWQLLK
jgi:hydroxyethylthiazole kinase-like uncharacterized protein yjeF